jgi:hypothetical protein
MKLCIYLDLNTLSQIIITHLRLKQQPIDNQSPKTLFTHQMVRSIGGQRRQQRR